MRRGMAGLTPDSSLAWLPRLIRTGRLVALAVVVIVAIVGYSTTVRLISAFEAVRHTREVEMSLTAMLVGLLNAETGQRGYLITGRPSYLQPYATAHATVTQEFVGLNTLLADEPAQQRRLAQLQPLVTAKFSQMDLTLALRDSKGFDAAAAVVAGDSGQAAMEQIRTLVDAMQQAETEQENAERATTQVEAGRAFRVIAIGGIVTFVLMAAANMVSERELRRRKRAEAALAVQYRRAEAARQESTAILNATNEAITLVDRDRRFLAVNRRFVELLGIPADAIVGRRFDEMQGYVDRIFEDADSFRRLVANSASDNRPEFGCFLAQQWPERRDLQFFSAPVAAADGVLFGRLYVLRDVTRERAVDRLKTEFVSLVSHELRTPLTSIKGYIDLLAAGEAGSLNADQLEFLDIVKSNADRLVGLINDLLDISRIEAGKMDLRQGPVALVPILRGVAAAQRLQIEAKRQTLTLDLPNVLPVAPGDADRLTQVFTNLLSNASKYTPTEGAIRVSASVDAGYVHVNVTDSGIGMSPEELDQLFTRFFRASNRLVQDAGGSGLGLAISRSLVELHGGEIRVRSASGSGSTFSVLLPLSPGMC